MKKILKSMLCIILLFSMVFSLAGCEDILLSIFGPQVNYISVEIEPDKTEYQKGENLDLTGGILLIQYTGDKENETLSMTASGVTASGYDKNETGTQTVSITYKLKTTAITVRVIEGGEIPYPDPNPDTAGDRVWGDYAPREGSNQTGAVRPHLIAESEREENPVRYINGVFATTNLSAYAVSTPTQVNSVLELLLNAVLAGRKPIVSSDAENPVTKIWSAAIEMLDTFIQNDFSEYERAHTIYDWLVYYVDYDWAMLDEYIANEGRVDGNNPDFHISGVFLNGVAVCDGISKAYTLLCAIEGIEVKRVLGTGDEVAHAWNKINIKAPGTDSKAWYIVDATWGCVSTEGESGDIEGYMSHAYFMLADSDLPGHIEEYLYPPAVTKWDYYELENLVFSNTSDLTDYIKEMAKKSAVALEVELDFEFGQEVLDSIFTVLYYNAGVTAMRAYNLNGNIYLFLIKY